jgi:hypothetical protein
MMTNMKKSMKQTTVRNKSYRLLKPWPCTSHNALVDYGCFFGTAHAIPLSDLFNFSDSIDGIENGLGVFWESGIYNLEREKTVYEEHAK